MEKYIRNELTEFIDALDFKDSALKNKCKIYIQNPVKYYYKEITNRNVFIKSFKKIFYIIQMYTKKDFYWNSLKTIILDNMELRNNLIDFVIFLSSTDYLDCALREEYQLAKETLIKAINNRVWSENTIPKMQYISSLLIAEYEIKNVPSIKTFCVNVNNVIIHDLLCEFIKSNIEVLGQSKSFFELFESSVDNKETLDKIETYKDFSIDIFKQQFKFYDKLGLSNVLCSFYLYFWSFDPEYDLFPKSSGIDYKTIKRKDFFKCYRAGYRLVLYNPLDPVPLFDRWIVDYNGFGNNTSLVNHGNGVSIDFTIVENEYYRYYVKAWLWKDASLSIYAKMSYYFQINRFFNYLSSTKKNNDLNIITLEDAISYKNYILSTVKSDTNASKYLYNIRGILRYIKEEKFMEIEEGIFFHLKYSSKSENNAKVISDEELKKLSDLMREYSEVSDLNKLYFLIFYIALETEFRITQILALEIDNVQETTKKNQYVINSKTKTSNGYKTPQSITIYVKKQIDDIVKTTQDLRDECVEKQLKKRLFIKRNYSRKQIISPITAENFNEYLAKCCEKLGINHYNASNLRDTHMTKAEEFIIRKGFSNIEQSVLTGHTNTEVENRHYIETKITDMLEIVHGTVIGDIDINGEIVINVDESIANLENEVENGCGYCKHEGCGIFSYLSCFMCNYFVTTVNRIPYFEEQIKIVDYKIPQATIQHDKEDLLNIKQLLLNYLRALYLKREDVNNNG